MGIFINLIIVLQGVCETIRTQMILSGSIGAQCTADMRTIRMEHPIFQSRILT